MKPVSTFTQHQLVGSSMRFSIRRGAGLVVGLLLGLQTILTTAIDLNPDDPGKSSFDIVTIPFLGEHGYIFFTRA